MSDRARELAHEIGIECWAYFGEGGAHSGQCGRATAIIESALRDVENAKAALAVIGPMIAAGCAEIARSYADAAEADMANGVDTNVGSLLLRDVCIAGRIERDIRAAFPPETPASRGEK